MNDLVMKISLCIGGIVLIGVLALVGGTFVQLLWPVCVPVAFPGLVASGVIVGKIGWWVSVCLTWLFGILIKGTNTVNTTSK